MTDSNMGGKMRLSMHHLGAAAAAVKAGMERIPDADEAAFGREFSVHTGLVEQMVELPSTTLDELAAKAAAISSWIGAEFDDPADFQDKAVFSVLRELVALTSRRASGLAEQAQVEGAAVAEDDEECFLAVHRFIDVPGYGELPEEMKGGRFVVFRRQRSGPDPLAA